MSFKLLFSPLTFLTTFGKLIELDVPITVYYEVFAWESTFMPIKVKSTNSVCTPAGVHSAVTEMQ